MQLETLPREMLEQMVGILRAHGVVHAALFGSFARGTPQEHSDVDLLVEMPEGTSLLDLAALELDLIDALGRPVEVVTYRALNPRIKAQVLGEQVVLM
jgi:uncharacterized protein